MKFITHKMCPFAQKAWIGLELFNIPYELQEIPLYGPNGKPAWFRKLNPKGTVPTLVVDDDRTVWTDSDDILDYLASSANDEDLFREWRDDVINQRLLPVAKGVVLGDDDTNELHAILEEINGHEVMTIDAANKILTIADCHAFPFLWRLDQESYIDETRFSNIHKWLRSCERHPAVATTIQSSWWWWW